jgi:hypothetical protein
VPRSVSSAFCIRGDRLCNDTHTSTVSYRVVDCRLITHGGSARHRSSFLPVRVLSRVFRGKFVAGLRRAFQRKQLVFFGPCQSLANEKAFAAFLRILFREDWVVYAKPPFGGPEHVLQYLARYTHRVAISNHRLLSVDSDHVTFSLEGLRASQYVPCHDPDVRRVPAPVTRSMFCPRVSRASATLAGSLIVGAGSCCRFAGGYSRSHRRLPKRTPLQPLSGSVRPAVAQCALLSC